MDNKELDKMIQDKLGDYRESPDPRVWDRVRTSLDGKKKKSRLIPLWIRWGAAAAIILAGLFWLTPREDIKVDTPAVGRSVPGSEAPADINSDSSSPEKSLPQESNEGLAGDSDALRKMDPSGSADDIEGMVSISGESDAPSRKVAGQGNPATDPLAFSQAENSDGVIPNEKSDLVVIGESRETPAEVSEKADALTDADTDHLKKGSGVTEKDKDAPTDAKLPEKSIFEAREPQEALAESEVPEGKWSIGPSLAPVYFNSFGNGSPIASNFLNNSKSGTLNMSYGLQVSYQLSKKLSLRSGIHRVDYGYNTDDVGFTSSPTARPSSLIRTISYSENSKNLVVTSTIGGGQPSQPPVASDVLAPSASREGQMLQEFGYLEIPLEMQYNLLDRKWGINLIGGLSSLFLVENSVSLQSGEAVTEIGEATNMNSLNFSTNLGLGFYYRLNSSFEVNLQPMFKYQLNTFSETSGSFRPYSVGVYSGLNFRF
ncbi:MAG: outer membrane beta-barrel protein, partial [Robiginitalea sp.]